jgi:hypothetical protein
MRKRAAYIFFMAAMLTSQFIFSQPTINGPVCVLPGVTYQYSFSNTGSLTDINMRVCVSGGSIVNRDQVRIGDCVESQVALSNVLVIWNDTTAGSVAITAITGNNTVNISLTSVLQPGNLDSLAKIQTFTDTTTIPSTINCSPAIGGSCSPNYSYQWQQSGDMLVWTDVEGSVGESLSFEISVKQTTYYRRKITETGSGTIGYSDIAAINVLIVQ